MSRSPASAQEAEDDVLPSAADGAQIARLRALYRTMLRIRRFDQRVTELFAAGAIKGTAHSCVG